MNFQNSNTVNPLLKIEVKTEDSVPPPRSSFHVTKEAIMSTQSKLSKAFFETLQTSLLALVKVQPQLTRFPALINDPFTLSALTYFKISTSDISQGTIPKAPKYHKTLNVNKREKKTSKAPQLAKEALSLEKQDSEEKVTKKSEEKQSMEPIQPPKTFKKALQKTVQNRIKNIPGLVLQRVRTSIKAYLTRNSKYEKRESRLDYVDNIYGCLSKQERRKALEYLDTYQKTWKTWNTIQEYLRSDLKYGSILLDTILKFFGEDGLEDFNCWLNTGRLGERSKAAVIDLKYKIGQKFSKLILETPDDSKKEEDDEMVFWENIVKKEKEEDSIVEKKEEYNSE